MQVKTGLNLILVWCH